MGLFSKIKEGLKKTKDSVFGQVHKLFKSMRKVDEEQLEELEELLIMSDVGYATAEKIIARLRDELKERKIEGGEEALEVLKEILVEIIGKDDVLHLDTAPSVILVIGVNGVGKTTTIAKLSAILKAEGKKVVLAPDLGGPRRRRSDKAERGRRSRGGGIRRGGVHEETRRRRSDRRHRGTSAQQEEPDG